jgi:hypothetical protein
MCVENYEDGSEIEREQEKNTHIDLRLRETLSRAALTIYIGVREKLSEPAASAPALRVWMVKVY